MSEEIIIINGEPFYRILNGTSYDYAPIPKEFKPYFERLQQENQQLKEECEKQRYAITENCDLRKEILKLEEVLDEIREYIEDDGISYLDLVGTRCWCNKQSANKLLQTLDKVKEHE